MPKEVPKEGTCLEDIPHPSQGWDSDFAGKVAFVHQMAEKFVEILPDRAGRQETSSTVLVGTTEKLFLETPLKLSEKLPLGNHCNSFPGECK